MNRLKELLRAREMNLTRLAAAGLGRSQVSQVLNGHPARGGDSRGMADAGDDTGGDRGDGMGAGGL